VCPRYLNRKKGREGRGEKVGSRAKKTSRTLNYPSLLGKIKNKGRKRKFW